MKTNPISQHSAAVALVQLLETFPNLPTAGWSIGSIVPDLCGHLYGGMDELTAFAQVLGGAVRAADVTYMLRGQEVRRHVLKTVWRDVPIEVAVTLPVTQSAQVSA